MRQVPQKCKNDMDGNFYVLAETSINSCADDTFNLYKNANKNLSKTNYQLKKNFKQFTNSLDDEFIVTKKNRFIEAKMLNY